MIPAWIKGITAALVVFVALPVVAAQPDPTGVWLMEKNKVAVRIYECSEGLCGRIVWLQEPVDKQGRLKRDQYNPKTALRNRPVCGIEVLTGLRPAGQDEWDGGTIYNPQDGKTYAASVRAVAPDTIEVRGYVGLPLFGKTKTLTRVYETANGTANSFADFVPAAHRCRWPQSPVPGTRSRGLSTSMAASAKGSSTTRAVTPIRPEKRRIAASRVNLPRTRRTSVIGPIASISRQGRFR